MIDRFVARIDLAVVLIVVIAGITGFNVWQRYAWTHVSGTVRNLTNGEAVVRVTDTSTGTVTGVWAIPGNSSALVVDGRPERWLLDPTPEEAALGRGTSFDVELFFGAACSVSAVGQLDDDSPTLDVLPDGLAITNLELVSTTGGGAPRAVADPCDGGPASAPGMIANLTSKPAIVGDSFVVPPCSTRIAQQRDMAVVVRPAAGVRFRVPSIEAQDERWPIEPRTVTLRRDGVWDEEVFGWGFDEDELAACRAASPR